MEESVLEDLREELRIRDNVFAKLRRRRKRFENLLWNCAMLTMVGIYLMISGYSIFGAILFTGAALTPLLFTLLTHKSDLATYQQGIDSFSRSSGIVQHVDPSRVDPSHDDPSHVAPRS